MSSEAFDVLHMDMLDHIKEKDLFFQDLYGGADPKYRIGVRVVTEYSWHNLFIRHLLIRPLSMSLKLMLTTSQLLTYPVFLLTQLSTDVEAKQS